MAFGGNAHVALDLWEGKPDVPTFKVPHPSSHNTAALLEQWRTAIPDLRAAVTPDPDGTQGGANYGSTFKESDYQAIPAGDLPFGLPTWVGDDAWGRRAKPTAQQLGRAAPRRPGAHPGVAGADALRTSSRPEPAPAGCAPCTVTAARPCRSRTPRSGR